MTELSAWVAHQTGKEQRIVRLEDALLANSFTRYFVYRLRYLLLRTAISTAFHALKIVLLLGAFPRSEFIVIVIAQAAVALVGDFWWGALEQLRSDVRLLQRRGRRDLVPQEIARWLSLAVRLALIPLLVGALYAYVTASTGEVGPVSLYVCVLLGAMAIDFVARAYHSGAYAIRRVYRPLPSLLALDVVSVGALLVLWPFLGLWAFPLAELISVVVVFAIALHYTTRTYRTLAIPTLMPLLRLRKRVPSPKTVREAILPGVSYALVGLEALVVVAGIASSTTANGASLVVLLAALGPVSRASFEWARLLYFDLKRLELPLLVDLRRKFDRAVLVLAVVMGLSGAALAGIVAVVLLPQPTALLLAALLALFLVRSLLAASQMQAFTRSAYVRLSVAGLAGVCGLVAVFFATSDAELRLFGVAGALALSLLLLLALPAPVDPSDLMAGPGEWLRRLRFAAGPVVVARLHFDARHSAPGTSAEARRTEAWRRETVAQRLATRVDRRGGATTWVGNHELWTYEPVRERSASADDIGWLVRASFGLIGRPPLVKTEADPSQAALRLGDVALGERERERERPAGSEPLPGADSVIEQFSTLVPSGIAYDMRKAPPLALARMPSDERVEIYRAAIHFARDLRRGSSDRGPAAVQPWEVTALVDDGVLRAVFAAPRTEAPVARRAWRRTVRAWNIRRGAGFEVVAAPARAATSTAAATGQPEGPAMM